MVPLPFFIRCAVTADLSLNALAAVIGPEHVMLVQHSTEQFGVLMVAGVVLHEIAVALHRAGRAARRWWRHRH